MGRGSIASITRRDRLNTVTWITTAGRIILPSLVVLVCLFVAVILARLVCIFGPPIQSRNRSRTENSSLSRRDCASSQAALRIGICLFSQFALSGIHRHGILTILVSLPCLFSQTIIVGLFILAVPRQPIQPSVSRKAGRSTISRERSRATQSILPSGYNLFMVRAGRCLAPSLESNNHTTSRNDGRARWPSLPTRTSHNAQSRIHYRGIDKARNGQRAAAL